MRWVLFAVVLVLAVGGFLLGWWVGKRDKKRVATAAVAVGLAFVLLRGVFAHFPTVEFAIFPFDFYAVIRAWWAVPFGMLVLGVGVFQMSTPLARKLVGVFAIGLLLSCLQRLYVTATFDPETVTGVVTNGVCAQTTEYTCGAAAAASLLFQFGVEATEREMAEVCWTNGLTGTDEFCVARGLRRKLAGTGRVIRVEEIDWDALVARTEPSVVTIHYDTFIDHWVMVQSVGEGHVMVGDPLEGYVSPYTKQEFLEKWTGCLVSADKQPR